MDSAARLTVALRAVYIKLDDLDTRNAGANDILRHIAMEQRFDLSRPDILAKFEFINAAQEALGKTALFREGTGG